MMEEGLVSIVVPVYNAEQFLDDTINTVLDQSYQNWELLLVNDCSTDKSKNVFEKYKEDKRIHWLEQENNVGPAATRNYGIREARGEYLCFLDADDKWVSDKIEKQVDFMQGGQYAFTYHSYEFADEMCVPNGKKVVARKKMVYNHALKNTIIFTSTVMFDMKKINKQMIMMPNLNYIEDTATWWRLLRGGVVAYGMPNVFAYYRRSSNTNSSNKLRTQKSLWHTYREVEKLNFFYAAYCWFLKNINAVMRRI